MKPPLIPILYELWEQFMFLRWSFQTLGAWARWRWAQLWLNWLYWRMGGFALTDPRLFVYSQQAAALRRTMRRQYRRYIDLIQEQF